MMTNIPSASFHSQEICKKRNFISICFPDIEAACDASACPAGALGFGKPPDASRQYCHVPAVALVSGYFSKTAFLRLEVWI